MKEKLKIIVPFLLIIVGVLLIVFKEDIADSLNLITAAVALFVSVFNIVLVCKDGNKNFVKLASMVFLPAVIVSLSTFNLVDSFGTEDKIEIGILLILCGILLEVKDAAFGKDMKFSLIGMSNLLFILAGLVIILFDIEYEQIVMVIASIVGLFGLIKALIWYFTREK